MYIEHICVSRKSVEEESNKNLLLWTSRLRWVVQVKKVKIQATILFQPTSNTQASPPRPSSFCCEWYPAKSLHQLHLQWLLGLDRQGVSRAMKGSQLYGVCAPNASPSLSLSLRNPCHPVLSDSPESPCPSAAAGSTALRRLFGLFPGKRPNYAAKPGSLHPSISGEAASAQHPPASPHPETPWMLRWRNFTWGIPDRNGGETGQRHTSLAGLLVTWCWKRTWLPPGPG